jgi:diguanylate cyclase (GGDEF)-like protein/PAS domain S-box-containing protein
MQGAINYLLVSFSLLLAIAASYVTLSVVSCINHVKHRRPWIWMLGGACSLGLAFWLMYFLSILPVRINSAMAFDPPLTLLSIANAIAISLLGILVAYYANAAIWMRLLASIFIAAGIASMQDSGLNALKLSPAIEYDTDYYLIALVIAVSVAYAGLTIFIAQAKRPVTVFRPFQSHRLGFAILLTLLMTGIHLSFAQALVLPPHMVSDTGSGSLAFNLVSTIVILLSLLISFTTLLLLIVSSQHQIYKRLLQDEKLFRQVINNAPQGMMVVNKHGVIDQVNRSMLLLTGFRYRELCGKAIEILIPEAQRKQHVQQRDEFLQQDSSRIKMTVREVYVQRKDGSSFPAEVTLAPILINGSKNILTTVVDITEHRTLQQELATKQRDLIEANQRITLATESAEIGIWDYNLIDKTLIWDDWMYRIHDFPTEHKKITYEAWSEILHPSDLIDIEQEVKRTLRHGKSFDTQYRILNQNGDIRWIKAIGSLIANDAGTPIRLTGITQDITDKIQREELIWQQANFDQLTLLPNRKLFHELLDQEIKNAHREKKNTWVLFMDLDGFKEVNDTLGHHAGDELLKQVAQRIRNSLREADIVARLGGDEFVVIISHSDELNAVDLIANKLIETIAESYSIDDSVVHISASIGVANYPNDAQNADDLLKFADQSMYISKQDGKNRITYFTPEYQQSAINRLQIIASLHRAVEQSSFELYYQPIVDLQNGSITKAEALIRWVDPQRGLVNPEGFIPLAEESGIICDIGMWVFEQAFKQLQQWLPELDESFQLSINMSPNQLRVMSSKYADWTEKLDQYDIDGQHLVIEITEGLLLKSDTLVNQRLAHYHDAGIQIAVDDFGTGYSSLAYLKEFNIDYLKIDKSFTNNLKPGSSELSLSETIVVMAHKLGLKVVAEGIETFEQLQMLKAMHCDYGQGYYFSRPMPVDEFESRYIGRECKSELIMSPV